MDELIYLDNSATTALDSRVLQAMLPYFYNNFANPASNHKFGLSVKTEIESARDRFATLINCNSREIIFTSGATEAINIGIKGLVLADKNERGRIIAIKTEHKAVLDCCAYLENIGYQVDYFSVDQYGELDIVKLKDSIDDNVVAVCAMLVNNETGVIHPIKLISEICHANNAYMICDATQGFGKLIIDVQELGVDLLCLSAHKFHGPKGSGVLFARNGLDISSFIHGGGQERGLRSGTMNVPGIIGLTIAAEIAIDEIEINSRHILNLRKRLESGLLALPESTLNGHPDNRCQHISNISFNGLDANTLIQKMDHLAVSNGSACTSLVFEPSHVLMAMGRDRESAYGSIRFSIGKYNSNEDIDLAINILKNYEFRFKQD